MKRVCETVTRTGARGALRLKALRALETNPQYRQRQFAAEQGVCLGGVSYSLQALIEQGFVKVNNHRKLGAKVASLYFLTPKVLAEKMSLATVPLSRKLWEYELST